MILYLSDWGQKRSVPRVYHRYRDCKTLNKPNRLKLEPKVVEIPDGQFVPLCTWCLHRRF